MRKTGNILAGTAVAAALVVALPHAGEAAWWKFGRDKVTTQPGTRPDDGALMPAQDQPSDRLNRIENTLRSLTGQVEELTFQLRQLQEQMKRAQEDNEFRFQELEGGPVRKKSATAPAPNASPPPVADVPAEGMATIAEPSIETLTEGLRPGGESGGQTLGEPPKSLGTIILDAPSAGSPDQPMDLSSAAKGGQPAERETAALAPTGDPRADYEAAYDSIRNGDYVRAEAGFRQFVATYPGDQLAPDAQYWLGESHFARGQYREAADEFIAGYKAYPKSDKGPDTLLKLGLSLAGLGERDMACSTYVKVLKQYPELSNAMRQRIKVEQVSARC